MNGCVLPLDSPRWAELEHAYGPATDLPALLAQLQGLPESAGVSEPWFSLWSALAHQGDVYSASFAAVPHVVAALESAPARAGFTYFSFPAWVEICRNDKAVEIPPDLASDYFEALSRLPTLVAAAASRAWDNNFLLGALSAIAASKGHHAIAEIVMELSPGGIEEFEQWLDDR